MGRHTNTAAAVDDDVIPARVRKWLYGIVTAAMPLLVTYGILDEARAPLWIALVAQVLATTTAYAHTRAE